MLLSLNCLNGTLGQCSGENEKYEDGCGFSKVPKGGQLDAIN